MYLVEPPTNDKLFDAMINIQAFVFNVFGCIDNLAWIWVKEAGLPITDKRIVGLFGGKTKEVRKSRGNFSSASATTSFGWPRIPVTASTLSATLVANFRAYLICVQDNAGQAKTKSSKYINCLRLIGDGCIYDRVLLG